MNLILQHQFPSILIFILLQADKEKYYHVFTAGKFPFFDWEKGEWSTFELRSGFCDDIARSYDPAIHKAPLWIGHPWFSGAPADGWIWGARSDGSRLYNSFEYIDEDFIKAVRDKKYCYVSCEFGKVMDIEGDYQVALGATNIPRVSGQKPLEFEGMKYSMAKGKSIYCPIDPEFTNELVKDFLPSNKTYSFSNQNKNSTMNEFLKRIAMAFAIDLSQFNTDEAVVTKVTSVYSQLVTDKQALEQKISVLEDQRIKFALEVAITEGRIEPAKKDDYENLLKGNFEAARKVIMSLPVNPALKQNTIPTGGANIDDPSNPTNDKFSNPDGSKITFEQFEKKVKEDPTFAKKFSDDEIASLPGASKFYDNSKK